MKEFSLTKKEFVSVIDFIKIKHDGQYRKYSLCPYFIHPVRVASMVYKYKESHKIDELVIASLCHDLLEDTSTTEKEIEEKFGLQVLSLVQELTTNKQECEKIGKANYLANKMINMSSWALVIKLCDRLDNISDFIYASDTFVQKYGNETLNILKVLICLRKDLSATHIKLINMIKMQLSMYNIEYKEIV